MASTIKVDQIQSDSGNVSLTGNLSSTTITTSTLSSTTGNVTVTSNVSVVGLQTSSNVSIAGKTLIDSTGRQYSVIGAGTTLFEEYKCRAWVNFNGNGTVSIRGSGNVSSITDNGTGNYTVNLTNALPDTNAGVLVSAGGMDTGVYVTFPTLGSYNSATNFILSTTQVRVYQSSAGNPNQTDPYFYCVAIFR